MRGQPCAIASTIRRRQTRPWRMGTAATRSRCRRRRRHAYQRRAAPPPGWHGRRSSRRLGRSGRQARRSSFRRAPAAQERSEGVPAIACRDRAPASLLSPPSLAFARHAVVVAVVLWVASGCHAERVADVGAVHAGIAARVAERRIGGLLRGRLCRLSSSGLGTTVGASDSCCSPVRAQAGRPTGSRRPASRASLRGRSRLPCLLRLGSRRIARGRTGRDGGRSRLRRVRRRVEALALAPAAGFSAGAKIPPMIRARNPPSMRSPTRGCPGGRSKPRRRCTNSYNPKVIAASPPKINTLPRDHACLATPSKASMADREPATNTRTPAIFRVLTEVGSFEGGAETARRAGGRANATRQLPCLGRIGARRTSASSTSTSARRRADRVPASAPAGQATNAIGPPTLRDSLTRQQKRGPRAKR